MPNPMRVFLQLRGKYTGIDPAHPAVVYADRTLANGWEAVTLVRLPNNRFTARYDAAGTYLTIDDLGNLRGSVTPAAWEEHCVISPPTEYKDTPSQLYQPTHGVVLEIEVQP